MRNNTCLQVITDRTDRYSAKVLVHMDMASNKCIHFHVQAWFHIGVLAIRQSADKEIYSNDFTGRLIHIPHCRTGPVNLQAFSGLMEQMVCQTVGNCIFSISLIELCLPHRKLVVPLTTVGIFLIEKFECDARLFQFLVDMFIIWIGEQDFTGMFIGKEKAIDFVFFHLTNIIITDAFFIRDVKHFTD